MDDHVNVDPSAYFLELKESESVLIRVQPVTSKSEIIDLNVGPKLLHSILIKCCTQYSLAEWTEMIHTFFND